MPFLYQAALAAKQLLSLTALHHVIPVQVPTRTKSSFRSLLTHLPLDEKNEFLHKCLK